MPDSVAALRKEWKMIGASEIWKSNLLADDHAFVERLFALAEALERERETPERIVKERELRGIITHLEARVAALEAGLRPFANWLDDRLSEYVKGAADTLRVKMIFDANDYVGNLTLGDLRRARALLAAAERAETRDCPMCGDPGGYGHVCPERSN